MTTSPGVAEPAELEALPRLVVMIPCLNEEQTVAEVVAAVPPSIPGVGEVQVVVIDDGSSDATAERAREAGAAVVRHEANLGLGRAFRTGLEQTLRMGADLVVNIDGDGQFDAGDIPKLVEPILRGEAHMATASRFADRQLVPEMPWIKRWGNRQVARIVWLISGKRFHDVSCGFRAYSREALLRMNLFGGFTYTQETFLDLAFKELRIVEIPVRVEGVRKFGSSRVAASLPTYAYRALKIMLQAGVSYRPFRFFATLASLFLTIGVLFLGFLFYHYLTTRGFSPHIWAGFVGGSFVLLGILTVVIGILGDMLVRMRLNQENTLYFLKRSALDRRVDR